MDTEWLLTWRDNENTGKMVNMPGNTSTSRSIKTALEFAKVPEQDACVTLKSGCGK